MDCPCRPNSASQYALDGFWRFPQSRPPDKPCPKCQWQQINHRPLVAPKSHPYVTAFHQTKQYEDVKPQYFDSANKHLSQLNPDWSSLWHGTGHSGIHSVVRAWIKAADSPLADVSHPRSD